MDKTYLLTTMASYPALYRAELLEMAPAIMQWKPSIREWSIAEVIAHLADSNELFLHERILPVLQHENHIFPGFDPDQLAIERAYNTQDPIANLAKYAQSNARLVLLGWEADWSRPCVHKEEGPMTFKDLMVRLFGHYSSHLHQMRRVKRQYLERMPESPRG